MISAGGPDPLELISSEIARHFLWQPYEDSINNPDQVQLETRRKDG